MEASAAFSSAALSHSWAPSVLFVQTVLRWMLKDICRDDSCQAPLRIYFPMCTQTLADLSFAR